MIKDYEEKKKKSALKNEKFNLQEHLKAEITQVTTHESSNSGD